MKAKAAKPKHPLRGKKGTVLSVKQDLFCTEYMKCGNASQAYKASYRADSMSGAAIRKEASELLKNPIITLRISGLRAKVDDAAIMSARESLIEASKLARFDIRRMFAPDGSPVAVHLLDDTTAAAIGGMDVFEEYAGKGKGRVLVGHVKKYKVFDKNVALEKLFKHHGLYGEDHKQNADGLLRFLNGLSGNTVGVVKDLSADNDDDA